MVTDFGPNRKPVCNLLISLGLPTYILFRTVVRYHAVVLCWYGVPLSNQFVLRNLWEYRHRSYSCQKLIYLDYIFVADSVTLTSVAAKLTVVLVGCLVRLQVKIWFQNRRNKWKRQLAAELEFPQCIGAPVMTSSRVTSSAGIPGISNVDAGIPASYLASLAHLPLLKLPLSTIVWQLRWRLTYPVWPIGLQGGRWKRGRL